MLINTKKLTKAQEIKRLHSKLKELYQFDAYGFFVNVLNANPTLDQISFLKDVSEPGGFYAYASGHHTGKSYIGGGTVLWLMWLYQESHTVLAADTWTKIQATIWKEVHRCKAVADRKAPFLKNQFVLTSEQFYEANHKESWLAQMKAAGNINKADTNFSGLHAKWLSLIFDEASGINDKIFDAVDGTATKATNRVILFSQRTKNTGRMHEAFGKLANVYRTRTFDTEKSPLVDIEEIKNYRKKFGGRHTDQYGIRVKGRAPKQQSGMLLARSICEELVRPVRHIQQPGYILICDPSGDGHRDRTALLIAKISNFEDMRVLETLELRDIPNLHDSQKHTMDVANEIAYIYKSGKYPGLSVGIDYIGVGHGVCHKLTELKVPHTRFQWGQPSWYKERFRDQKMEGYQWLKEAVDRQGIKFLENYFFNDLMDELDKLPFDYNDKGLKYMWEKVRLRKEGISSPDLADCYAMAFLMDYLPIGKTKTIEAQEIEDSIDLSWMDEL